MTWKNNPVPMAAPIRQARTMLTVTAPSPEQELAAAVLEQAIDDALSESAPAAHRASAAEFLKGGALLEFWSGVAGVEAALVGQRARQLIGSGQRARARRLPDAA
jgi:hypothetical protein